MMDGNTSILFERGEIRLMVKEIPALVCPRCGEAHVDEATINYLLNKTESVLEQGIIEESLEYFA